MSRVHSLSAWIVAALLWSSPAGAAGSLVQAKGAFITSGSASSISVSFDATVGAAHLVDVWVTWFNGVSGGVNNVSSITDDKSNTYHLEDAVFDNGPSSGFQSAYLEGINNGPITITVNFIDANPTNIVVWVDEYAGLVTASAIDGHTMQSQVAPGAGTDVTTSGNITTGTAGDLISSGIISATLDVGSTFAHGTGFTDAGVNIGAIEYKTQIAAGAVAGTWTSTPGTEDISTGVMAFKALSSSSPCPSRALLGVGC